jgi:hypothetical protein
VNNLLIQYEQKFFANRLGVAVKFARRRKEASENEAQSSNFARAVSGKPNINRVTTIYNYDQFN